MMEMDSELLQSVRLIGEAQHILPHEINLGTHHLLLNSDQSIELMCAEQGQSEPEYVLCLDATETYRLMQCLCELFR